MMVSRVLDFYNCFEIDDDQDGMSDFCEERYNISDPYGDEDGDTILNTNECYYGLDPNNADTDGGGVMDKDELRLGSDPKNPFDDIDLGGDREDGLEGIEGLGDQDGDGLKDIEEEQIYKTDPGNPDTDGGGVTDGVEVLEQFTDPLYAPDDYPTIGEEGEEEDRKTGKQEGESGLYISPAECTTCPCPSTFLHKADVIEGDKFFTVISTYDEKYIFNKSNEVIVNIVK